VLTASHHQKNIRLLIICVLISLVLYLIGFSESLVIALVISITMGFTIRYVRLWLASRRPNLLLAVQYLIASLTALVLWGILPLLYWYHLDAQSIIGAVQKYAAIFIVTALIVAVVSYFYYRMEQAWLLQQALDKAEIQRIKQDKQLLETQLRLLQSQIEPHFLFNTLANIQALISIEPKLASKMLTALTSLLRQSLQRTRDELLTLSHELRFNKAYLTIQQIRLGDRLRVHFDISDKILDSMQFPPMLLQPLIENAIIHGIEPLADGGDLALTIKIINNRLLIRIENDCALQPQTSKHRGHHIGLTNIQQRLTQLYGEQAKFEFNDSVAGKVVVEMEVPLDVAAV